MVSPSSGNVEMPILVVMRTSCCRSDINGVSASMMRIAGAQARSSLAISSRSTANSSPPRRATVSELRTVLVSRRATSVST